MASGGIILVGVIFSVSFLCILATLLYKMVARYLNQLTIEQFFHVE